LYSRECQNHIGNVNVMRKKTKNKQNMERKESSLEHN